MGQQWTQSPGLTHAPGFCGLLPPRLLCLRSPSPSDKQIDSHVSIILFANQMVLGQLYRVTTLLLLTNQTTVLFNPVL